MIVRDEIIKLRNEGKTINEIVKILGCAKSTVSYNINKIGLGGNSTTQKSILNKTIENSIGQEEKDIIINYRLSGNTFEEIFSKTKLSKDKVRKILKEVGLNKQLFKYKDFNKEEILKTYLEFKSIRKTAKHLKISKESVRKIIGDNIIYTPRYLNHEDKKKQRSKDVIDWRKRAKEKLLEYKGGKCERCGYDKCKDALEFHHINPKEKDFSISRKSYSLEKLLNEVDKCILVCSNCHKEIHFEMKNILTE